ncbi:MAG: Ig-like domain-containing protein [Alloprevotella sp.]
MKKTVTERFFLSLCMLTLFSLFGGDLSAQATKSVTYTIASATSVTASEDITGVTASFNNTYTSNKQQIIKGNSMTLTLAGFTAPIKKIVMSMHTNKSAGAGTINVTVGGKEYYNKAFDGSYSQTFYDYTIAGDETAQAYTGDVVIKIACTTNSLYCATFTIYYAEESGTGTNQTLAFSASTVDVYSGESVTKPELSGAMTTVSYESSNTAVATVDENTGDVSIVGIGTTTITATAAAETVGGTEYNKGTKSYTLNVWPANIAQLKGMITGTSASTTNAFKAKLTNAYITYVNGNNAFLQDATGAILIYKSSHGLTAGDCYSGEVSGTAFKYNGLNEINNFDFSAATKTTTTVPAPTEVTFEQLNADFDAYENQYIVVKGVVAGGNITAKGGSCTLTQSGSEYTPTLYASAAVEIVGGNSYDIIVFPGINNSSQQLRVWEQSHITAIAGKSLPGLAFEQPTYTTETNALITVKATATSDGAITYSVADTEEHITVDEQTGEVLADAAGTYTVTATIAETENYYGGTATCQVVVNLPSAHISPVTYYKKITSTEELVYGGQYVIVCEEKNKGLLADGTDIEDATPASVTPVDHCIATSTAEEGLTVFTLVEGFKDATSYYCFQSPDNNYLYNSSSTNLTLNSNMGTDNAKWTISFTNGNVKITNLSTSRWISLNTAAGGGKFRPYEQNYTSIQLYQKVGELTIQKAVDGYATYVTDFAYRMPKTLTGKTVSAAKADGSLTIDDAYVGLAEVPALTPLLIKTSDSYAADESQKTYYPVVLNKSLEAYTGSNLLEGWRALDGKTTQTKKAESVYYYKLALNSSNEPGFYWGADGGAAFEMQNGATAYLTVEQSILSGAEGFRLGFGGNTTAIEGVSLESNESQPVYNLQGVRLNTKAGQLPRGLYIQGGKKVIIK